MREAANAERVQRFLEALGRRTRGPGKVYLVGGSTAVLFGWRNSTADIDVKLQPEPSGAFEAIADLKNELDVNVELASPDQFLPAVPGWEARSLSIGRYGALEVFH